MIITRMKMKFFKYLHLNPPFLYSFEKSIDPRLSFQVRKMKLELNWIIDIFKDMLYILDISVISLY